MNPTAAAESLGSSSTTEPQSAVDSRHSHVSPSPVLSVLQQIEEEQKRHERALEELERKREQAAQEQLKARGAVIERFKAELGVKSDEELILILRNRGISSPKAKRLPDAVLTEMKKALANGATAPEVAKYFRVSLATVHARKAAWKLTHRKNVKPKALKDALKG